MRMTRGNMPKTRGIACLRRAWSLLGIAVVCGVGVFHPTIRRTCGLVITVKAVLRISRRFNLRTSKLRAAPVASLRRAHGPEPTHKRHIPKNWKTSAVAGWVQPVSWRERSPRAGCFAQALRC